MGVGEDTGSGITVQKDLGIRDGIVGLVEGFSTSTMLDLVLFQTDLVLLHPLLESSNIGA